MVNLKQKRWRWRNRLRAQLTIVDPLPYVAPRYARQTCRVVELAVLLAHEAGGRPAERLMTRLGLPQSDDAQGAVQGALQARQVADRFHLLQNLRQSIERQLSRSPCPSLPVLLSEGSLAPPDTVIRRYGQPEVTEDRHLVRTGRRAVLHRKFAQVKVAG